MWTGEKGELVSKMDMEKNQKKNWRIGIVTKLLEILSILLTNFLTAAPLEATHPSSSLIDIFSVTIFQNLF